MKKNVKKDDKDFKKLSLGNKILNIALIVIVAIVIIYLLINLFK